jgi:hypothetical protein
MKRRSLLNQMRNLRRSHIADPDFLRMEYIRYADDFVVFVSGSLKDAKFNQSNIKDVFKTNWGLERNQKKNKNKQTQKQTKKHKKQKQKQTKKQQTKNKIISNLSKEK